MGEVIPIRRGVKIGQAAEPAASGKPALQLLRFAPDRHNDPNPKETFWREYWKAKLASAERNHVEMQRLHAWHVLGESPHDWSGRTKAAELAEHVAYRFLALTPAPTRELHRLKFERQWLGARKASYNASAMRFVEEEGQRLAAATRARRERRAREG